MRTAAAAAGSAVFFAAAPGVVAGVVPWWLTRWEARELGALGPPLRVAGGALVLAGGTVLVGSFARFVREGAGTPAPVAPPERLVVGGLYRHVRNPMYVAVVATITGQALVLGRPVLMAYGAGAWAAVAAFVRWYEEPTLTRRFGADYAAYRAGVRAWWPRRQPWTPA